MSKPQKELPPIAIISDLETYRRFMRAQKSQPTFEHLHRFTLAEFKATFDPGDSMIYPFLIVTWETLDTILHYVTNMAVIVLTADDIGKSLTDEQIELTAEREISVLNSAIINELGDLKRERGTPPQPHDPQ